MNLPRIPLLFAGLGLLALGASAPVFAQENDPRLDTLQKELQEEQKQLREIVKETDDEDAVGQLYQDFARDVLPGFAERYAALARETKGTPLSLQAWVEVISLASQCNANALAKEALTTITTDHLQSETLAGLCGTLRYSVPGVSEDDVVAALRVVAERSPHRKVQASARYSLASVLAGENRPDNDPKLGEAKAVLASFQKDFADVKSPDGRTYADAAQAFLFALENLIPGKPCPDFSALDAEGAGFKLSDYKGKVVLVDFWGFW